MKTEEELDALNAEVEAGNEPLRELSDDDLSGRRRT